MDKKLISIVTPCYNEEDNVENLYLQVQQIMDSVPQYDYEHVFIDNASLDNTVNVLKGLAQGDDKVKIIVNARNFGFMRSQYHGLLSAKGDAVILVVADLQDPPPMILQFLEKWEEGYKIVVGVKPKSYENKLMFLVRKVFYNLISRISETEQIKNFTGFGLYDQQFVGVLRTLDEPYPYFRGLVSELGFNRIELPFVQPKREKGKSNYSFYNLYDTAIVGIVNYSKVPLRLVSFAGVCVSIVSLLIAFIYFVYKIIFWNKFQVGIAPLVIGIFLLGGIQLFFLGILGEYVGVILTQVKKRPLVIEKERVNFDH